MAKQLVVDADGHVLEPPDLWERYLEPRYRDRAMRIRELDNGDEYLEVDRKMHFFGPGAMGGNGGAFLDPHDIIYNKMKYWETATKYTPGGSTRTRASRRWTRKELISRCSIPRLGCAGRANARIRNCPPRIAVRTTISCSTFARSIPTA